MARKQVEKDLLEGKPTQSAYTQCLELKNTPATTNPRPIRHTTQSQPLQQPQEHQPMRQAIVQQTPIQKQRNNPQQFDYQPSSNNPRASNQPWNYKPNIDRLRQVNRETMDHTFRSRTPNYYSSTGTFDRTAAGKNC